MNRKIILLSIKPKYASLIRSGEKKVELRRRIPKITSGDTIVVYESAPQKCISMLFTVDHVLSATPEELWKLVRQDCGVTEHQFFGYFSKVDTAYGIVIGGITFLDSYIPISALKSVTRAPQSYLFLSSDDLEIIKNTNAADVNKK